MTRITREQIEQLLNSPLEIWVVDLMEGLRDLQEARRDIDLMVEVIEGSTQNPCLLDLAKEMADKYA